MVIIFPACEVANDFIPSSLLELLKYDLSRMTLKTQGTRHVGRSFSGLLGDAQFAEGPLFCKFRIVSHLKFSFDLFMFRHFSTNLVPKASACQMISHSLYALVSKNREIDMAKKNGSKRRAWTAGDVRTLKSLARKKTKAARIAKSLKRTEGATRQKAFSLGVSLDARV